MNFSLDVSVTNDIEISLQIAISWQAYSTNVAIQLKLSLSPRWSFDSPSSLLPRHPLFSLSQSRGFHLTLLCWIHPFIDLLLYRFPNLPQYWTCSNTTCHDSTSLQDILILRVGKWLQKSQNTQSISRGLVISPFEHCSITKYFLPKTLQAKRT